MRGRFGNRSAWLNLGHLLSVSGAVVLVVALEGVSKRDSDREGES